MDFVEYLLTWRFSHPSFPPSFPIRFLTMASVENTEHAICIEKPDDLDTGATDLRHVTQPSYSSDSSSLHMDHVAEVHCAEM